MRGGLRRADLRVRRGRPRGSGHRRRRAAGAPRLYQRFTADGTLNDARDVIVGTTNASLFAYVADGKNGLKVVQLTSPDIAAEVLRLQPRAQARS